MVVVTDTASQPHAVVVKSVTATTAQLTVLSVVGDDNLKQNYTH